MQVQITGHGDIEILQQFGKGSVGRQPRERRVRACGIAVPEINEHTLERLAGLHVQHADVQPQWNTGLVFRHVLTESLGLGPDVGPLCDLGREHAGVILDGFVVWGLGLDLVCGVC